MSPPDDPSTPRDRALTAAVLLDLRDDLRRRLPVYARDWRDGIHGKIVASALFLFIACLAPAVAFGGLMSEQTGGSIGVIEMIAATAVCGVAYAIFSGQPLTILGGTGPMLVFTGLIYNGCVDLGIPFLPTYAWIGLWTGGFSILMALTGAGRLLRFFTRFTDETFAALISLIFIREAVFNVGHTFPDPHVANDGALLSVVLALGTYSLATGLSRMRESPYLRASLREFLTDFGPAIAVAAMTGVRWMLPAVHVPQLSVPDHLAPTQARAWLVPLTSVPGWVPWAAAGPALLASILVFLDQNITTRLVNAPRHRLARGPAYHLDMLVVGLLIGLCSLVGLPWLVAATVHSLSHVRSLATTEADGADQRRIVSVRENRVSALLIHSLIGAALFATGALRLIPMSVLYGLFLFMGVSSLHGNSLIERARMWAMDPARYRLGHRLKRAPLATVRWYTVVQLGCLAALWWIKTSRVGIVFPLAIAALVPVRILLGRWLDPEVIATLDTDEEPDETEDRRVE